MKIEIILAEKEVGTKAIVTTPRLFGLLPPKYTYYTCIGKHPMTDPLWSETDTGVPASQNMEFALNTAAQDKAIAAFWQRGRRAA